MGLFPWDIAPTAGQLRANNSLAEPMFRLAAQQRAWSPAALVTHLRVAITAVRKSVTYLNENVTFSSCEPNTLD
jgi:hypothetical protein